MLLASIVAVLAAVMPSRADAAAAFSAAGYPLVLLAFGLWLLSLWPRSARAQIPKQPVAGEAWTVRIAPWLLAAVLIAGILGTSPLRFRILNDEALLLNAAFSLVDHGRPDQCFGLFRDGIFEPAQKCWWDKRPLVYPMLVSLLHHTTGYRPGNGFILNSLAGFLSLGVFFWLLRRWFSGALAAVGCIVLAAHPLFALIVTSSGFEIVNLLFVLLAFTFFTRFIRSDDIREIERLGFTLVLLAQVRYESILVAAAMLPVVAFRLRASGAWRGLRWRAALLPLLLLPVAWQRVAELAGDHAWTPPEEAPFSLVWLTNNLASAWRFFNGLESAYAMIPLVFPLALVGSAIALREAARRRRDPRIAGFGFGFGMSVVGLATVTFSYYWGDLTVPSAMRLGLVFVPAIVGLALLPLRAVLGEGARRGAIAVVAALGLLPLTWPVAARDEAMGSMVLAREYAAVLGLLSGYDPEEDVVLITVQTVLYTPHRQSSLSFRMANRQASSLPSLLWRRGVDEILVVQRVGETGEAMGGTRLDPAYVLESLAELKLRRNEVLRISRVVSQEPSGGSAP